MVWLTFLMALAAGAANPFQSGTNAELNKQLGQPVWAGVIVYATGFLGLLLMLAVVREPLPTMAQAAAVKPWAWFGGLISIASTMAGLVLAQRLGSGVFTGLTLTASLVTSVVLDQMGMIGFKQHTASPGRLVGCGLMVAGVWMITRF
jgi:transporter family-2 protein